MQVICFIIALIICPICYFYIIERMDVAAIKDPPRLCIFCIFGTIGGWFLAMALSPSGLAAMCVVFLITVSPIALLITSPVTSSKRRQSLYHKISAWIGFSYLILLILGVLILKYWNAYSLISVII